ncbi:MAG TPA: hypothetical protein VHQ24_06720 [Lachnospiraceae bacterium]|nr:hypothetical protein [Lachnospiraceae bacterium]
MKCRSCNTELEPNTEVCPVCGSSVTTSIDEASNQAGSYSLVEDDEGRYVVGSEPIQEYQNTNEYVGEVWPMGWYKFLIYFSLFLSAALHLYYAYQCITGSLYNMNGFDGKEYVYTLYPNLKLFDIVYGILLVALALLCIFTRQKLRHYSKKGPTLILTLYAVGLLMAIFYIVMFGAITGISVSNFIDSKMIIDFIMPIVMVVVNKVYFSHRAHLFVN